MAVTESATLTATRTVLDGNHGAGIYATSGAMVSLESVAIRDTRPEPGDQRFGRGLTVETATLIGTRLLVEGSYDIAAHVAESGASLVLTDTILRDTESRETDGTGGEGLSIMRSASLMGERIALVGNRYSGIAMHDGASLDATDLLVRDTLGQAADDASGRALSVQTGSSVVLERAVLERNREIAAYVDGSTATLTDVVVRDTLSDASTALRGAGLSAQNAATVTVTRGAFDRNRNFGLLSTGIDTRLELTDVVVREVLPQEGNLLGGQGVAVELSGALSLVRVRVERALDSGVLVDMSATATLEDVAVHDTASGAADGKGGTGIQAQLGSRVTGARVLVDGAQGMGISAVVGPVVMLEDVTVRRVSAWQCAGTATCPTAAHGYGLASFAGHLDIRRFVVEGAALCGVLVHGDVDLVDGVVRGSEIGACLQHEGFDIARVMNGVAYEDNGSNLDSTMLPVPGASGPVEDLEGLTP